MKQENGYKSNMETLIESFQANYENQNQAKVHHKPDNSNEERKPQIKNMPITDHPHREEILD